MIKDLLFNKTPQEQSRIKSEGIAALNHIGKFKDKDLEVEILSLKTVEINGQHGVEIMARAWKNGKSLGLGSGRTFEIERFRIWDITDTTVPDPNGDIIENWTYKGEAKQEKFRDDPVELIRQHLAYVIGMTSKEGKVVKGTIGNTTDSFYPSAGANDPFDGAVSEEVDETTFSGLRAGTANYTWVDDLTMGAALRSGPTTNKYYILSRTIVGFPTTNIGTGNISSAILSFYRSDVAILLGDTDIDIVSATPANNNNLVTGDFKKLGTTRLATGKAISTLTSAQYYDFTLNADGLAYINKSTDTFFGLRLKWDTDNNFTGTWPAAYKYTRASFYSADNGSNKPRLVVVHNVAATSNFFQLF